MKLWKVLQAQAWLIEETEVNSITSNLLGCRFIVWLLGAVSHILVLELFGKRKFQRQAQTNILPPNPSEIWGSIKSKSGFCNMSRFLEFSFPTWFACERDLGLKMKWLLGRDFSMSKLFYNCPLQDFLHFPLNHFFLTTVPNRILDLMDYFGLIQSGKS